MANITLPLFQNQRDLNFFRRVARELYKTMFIKVAVYLYDRRLKDDLYGEATDQSFNYGSSEPSYYVEAFIPEIAEWTADLTKYGVNENRTLKAHFFYDTFTEMGVIPPALGDHITIVGDRYKVTEDTPSEYFLNTQIPLTLTVILTQTRENVFRGPRFEKTGDDVYPLSELAAVSAGDQLSPEPAPQLPPPQVSPLAPDPAQQPATPDDGGQFGAHEFGHDIYGDR